MTPITLSPPSLRPEIAPTLPSYRRGMPNSYRRGMPNSYRRGMPRLYIAFAIFTLFSSSSSFSQRPDLIIGAHLNQQMLFDPGLDQHYYTPGIAVDMEVSKNKLAGGISLGMKGADPRNRTENPTQFIKYFVNVDLSFGVFLIKHPAFKWRFNMGASNMFNVNKYRENSAFNIPGYSLLAYPELHFRYKYYIASVYYSLPLVGFDSRGTGIKIGIGF